MKDLGEYLKNARVENGVSIDEVSEDLQIDVNAIENIESGNIRAFKDMYVLKDLVRDYAKYLGLDVNHVVDEFNDFLFCHTSKISLDKIKKNEALKNDEEKKVVSPYTVIPKQKKDYSKVIKIVLSIILFLILIFIIINLIPSKKDITQELKGVDLNEFTYKINGI